MTTDANSRPWARKSGPRCCNAWASIAYVAFLRCFRR
jgi:hypothetical protein